MNVFYQPAPDLKGDGSAQFCTAHRVGSTGSPPNIAVAEDSPWSGEGPNEATISLLANERL